jgi:hypothetical protein
LKRFSIYNTKRIKKWSDYSENITKREPVVKENLKIVEVDRAGKYLGKETFRILDYTVIN